MSTKLFVGGLPWAMDNERLKQVFAEFGDLEDARVILDRDTGRSRGFGFVTYANDESAEKALSINGQEVDGRRIRVDRAQEKERPARSGPGGRPRNNDRNAARPSGPPGPGGFDRDRGRPAPAAPPPASDRADRADRSDRSRGAREPARDFNEDWGGGGPGRDRGRRAKGGAPAAPSVKGRSRRRGGRGARGGGSESGGPPEDDFDDFE